MALSSQNSVSPPLAPEDSPERTYSLYSVSNADGGDFSEHQGSGQQDIGSDVEIDVDTGDNRREEGNLSTNVREIREESNYGDDEKGGSGLETESVDYADGESELMRDDPHLRDGSVSPSYSSLRVEPDLEDSHSHLRLEEIFEGDGSATESEMDRTNLSEQFAVSELELIERALQSLQNNHKNGVSGFSVASANGEPEDIAVDERGPPSPDYRGDATGVSRLLKKVQAVREQKRDALVTRRRDNDRSPRPRSISTSGDQDVDFADMRQLIQAASRAASSAAKAAEIMVRSMDRNSQAVEELCKTLACNTSSAGNAVTQDEVAGSEGNNDRTNLQLAKLQESELDIELRQAELTKKLHRQHRITHWVLGFMIVTTFAWRVGVVKFVKRVNHAVSNPIQGITGYIDTIRGVSSDDKCDGKQERGLKLPSILPTGDSDGDHKDGELPFNLGKILPHCGGPDSEVHP